ncbi:AraC family transcriptional regulator [Pararobbsia silviterrae]|uniref:AraC family transcriptional regulator n=1 Tax=Pararobbsia silviterrae TaxID=1792498 RepID=A0A494YCD4_9BURK|nr:helix-turn-helix transcriptional regulator [Pararobbsia silviterrae]RKP57654.1 AraC family transcriptional regulator [Pararobbsia silviterrae]
MASPLRDHHRPAMPVSARAVDFPAGNIRPLHHHTTAQLIYAVDGVMVVSTHAGQRVVAPTQGFWMPALTDHTIRMVTPVSMRTLYIQADAVAGLPERCHTVAIPALLRHLILSAMAVTGDYGPDSRDGRLMGLILDELRFSPVLPVHLPLPADPRARTICEAIRAEPESKRTLSSWAEAIGVDVKTIQRVFAQQTGLTFGQWRQQARLLIALERLAAGERIVDVALSLGYDSPSAFAAVFKKRLGVVPSAYFRGKA